MMKSRLSLKNSARLTLSFLIVTSLMLGCSSSTKPTFLKEDIDKAILSICKNEYKTDVKVRLVGRTLWVYLPLEDLLEKAKTPQEYLERFVIEQNTDDFKNDSFKVKYLIKPVTEQKKYQDIKYSEAALNKVNGVWRVIRRVLFSMETEKGKEPRFIYVVTADIKNGYIIEDTVYYPDLKKVSYDFISMSEYQHRSIQNTEVSPQIIGDKEGTHLEYRDITFKEFLGLQVLNRIKLKFQKPEVDKNADIDKEILKVITYTMNTYGYKDFSEVELNNLLTKNKILLNQRAVLEGPTEK